MSAEASAVRPISREAVAPTTPFELDLCHQIEADLLRFSNEWLFQWHKINMPNRIVDVDDFNGRRISLGGCVFEGQPQDIYWQAVGRHLTNYTRATVSRWSVETASYPIKLKVASLKKCEALLIYYIAQIVSRATDTDQRLRGRGFPEQDVPLHSSRTQSLANSNARTLIAAQSALLAEGTNTWISAANRWAIQNAGLLAVCGILIAIASAIIAL